MQTSPAKEIPAEKGVVVSIHDVSPLTRAVAEQMLADLAADGAGRISLLVIPNHHHRAPILEDADFCQWLRNCVAAGHEVVLHGYHHLRDRRAGDGLAKRLVTESYTAGEGEFHDLPEDSAADLLQKGREEFRSIGLDPAGFIAPAWLLGPEATKAVQRLGFEYTTRLGTVDDLQTGRVFASQSLVYSVRAAWRRTVSLAWNEFLLRRLASLPLIRLGLHPPDWRHPAIRRHARNCLTRALVDRDAMTYEGWLRRQRAVPSR